MTYEMEIGRDYDVRDSLKTILGTGFICAGSAPRLHAKLRADEALRDAVCIGLQPFMLTLREDDKGLYYYLADQDIQGLERNAREFLTRSLGALRYTVAFRQLIGKLVPGDQEVVPGIWLDGNEVASRAQQHSWLGELVDECYTMRKRAGRPIEAGVAKKVEVVFEEAADCGLIQVKKSERGESYVVIAGMLYLHALIDTIFEQQSLQIEEPEEMADTQERLL